MDAITYYSANSTVNIDQIDISDLVYLAIEDVFQLYGMEMPIQKPFVDYKITIALLGELLQYTKELHRDLYQELVEFLDEHSSVEELYSKIQYILTEFTSLHPRMLKSIAFDISETLHLQETGIAEEFLVQKILLVASQLERSYAQLYLI